LGSLSPREKAPAIPPSRVPRCFLLTGPHTSTARSSEPSVPGSPRSPALPRIPPQATGRFRLLRCCCPLPTLAIESVSTRYRALRASGWLAVTVPRSRAFLQLRCLSILCISAEVSADLAIAQSLAARHSPVAKPGSDAVEASVPKLFWLSRCCRSIPSGTLAARRLPATQKTYSTVGLRLPLP
jgi:hypothetical protein